MTDDTRHSPGRSPTDASRLQTPRPAGQEFQQLTLAPTLTGPGMRTEDHYERGAKVKIRGQRGVFTYRHASISQAGHVSLHLVGDDGCRAARPDQVTLVRKRGASR